MSSQGLNSSSYNGFYFTAPTGTTGGYAGNTYGAGIFYGFPTRDSSDYTKRIKEIALYREYKNTASVTGSSEPYHNSFVVPVDYTIVQSNQNKLTYEFGRIGCTGCAGPFPNLPLGT